MRVGLFEASGPYLSSMSEDDYVTPPSIVGKFIDPDKGHSNSYTPLLLALRLLLTPLSVFYVLRKTKPDVIVTFLQGTSFATVPAVALHGRHRLRWIAREGNNTMAVIDNEIRNITLRRFVGAIIRHAYNRADRVLTISNCLGTSLAKRFAIPAENVATIYNAVDLATIRRRAAASVSVDWPVDKPYIVSIGRLEHQKGHDVLLQAYALADARHEMQLVILGEGSELDALRAQAADLGIADGVHFAGFRDNPWAYAAGAEMFVLASRWEGFGNAVIEAMACRLPVIVTDCDFGPREIVTDGMNGLVVRTDSADELAEAIDRLHRDPALRQRLTACGMERARDFDVARITAQYEDLFALEAAKLEARSLAATL